MQVSDSSPCTSRHEESQCGRVHVHKTPETRGQTALMDTIYKRVWMLNCVEPHKHSPVNTSSSHLSKLSRFVSNTVFSPHHSRTKMESFTFSPQLIWEDLIPTFKIREGNKQ